MMYETMTRPPFPFVPVCVNLVHVNVFPIVTKIWMKTNKKNKLYVIIQFDTYVLLIHLTYWCTSHTPTPNTVAVSISSQRNGLKQREKGIMREHLLR